MRTHFRHGVIALALLGSAGMTAAQAQIIIVREDLTPTQRTTIYRTVTKERVVSQPSSGVQMRVGARVPRSVELYAIPETVVIDVPTVKRYRYMEVNNQVVLVDPDTSEVVEIISE